MKSHAPTRVCSNELPEALSSAASGVVWEYGDRQPMAAARCEGGDAAARVAAALRSPVDFPSVTEAIVPGDQIALAVDPNVPELAAVLRGCLETLWEPGEPPLQVVLWEEANERLLADLAGACHAGLEFHRHRSADRGSLSYLAADAAAHPIYLSRALVDADFLLPVIAHRPLGQPGPLGLSDRDDPTGLYPHFADSASRRRFLGLGRRKSAAPERPEVDWLLGVQVMLRVAAGTGFGAGEIWAGTPRSLSGQRPALSGQRPATSSQSRHDLPPAALVVACMDGDEAQQTWANAIRAIAAAREFTAPAGTIVLWSGLSQLPPDGLARRVQEGAGGEEARFENSAAPDDDAPEEDAPDDDAPEEDAPEEDALEEGRNETRLPPWNEAVELAPVLRSVLAEHRVLIHSRLDRETIESLSVGVIEGLDQLRRLSAQHPHAGLLPAAQFAGTPLPMSPLGSA